MESNPPKFFLDPYLQKFLVENLSPEDFPAFCGTSKTNQRLCLEFLERKLKDTPYQGMNSQFYPKIYSLWHQRNLLVGDYNWESGVINPQIPVKSFSNPEIPVESFLNPLNLKIKTIYTPYILTTNGDLYKFQDNNELTLELKDKQIREIIHLSFAAIGNRERWLFLAQNGQLYGRSGLQYQLIPIPHPIVCYLGKDLFLLKNGGVFSKELMTILLTLPSTIQVDQIRQAIFLPARLQMIVCLFQDGTIEYVVEGTPSEIRSGDETGDIVQIREKGYRENDWSGKILALTRNGQMIEITYQERQTATRKIIPVPSGVGPIIALPTPNQPNIFVTISGQVYDLNIDEKNWIPILNNAQISQFDNESSYFWRNQILALGSLLNDYFEDLKLGQISNIQVLDTDVYQNSLISYTLTTSEGEISRKSWVDLNLPQISPRAIFPGRYIQQYTADDSTLQSSIQGSIRESVRWGKLYRDGDFSPNPKRNLFYLVGPNLLVQIIEAIEINGEIFPIPEIFI